MTDVAKHAQRILAGTRKGSDRERIFPGYVSFDEGARPDWWKDGTVPDAWGRILGVHENEPNTRTDAIVVTDTGLGLLRSNADTIWIAYTNIDGWDKLSKEPISRLLRVRLKSGESIDLPFNRGGAFAFVQFLGHALREASQKQISS